MRFKDQVVVITGAGRGMGKALALALAREGAHLVICSRHQAEVDETAKVCEALGVSALALGLDVTQSAAVDALARAGLEKFGRLDGWVNNAGIWGMGSIDELTDAQWNEMIAINLTGVFNGTRAAAQVMKAAQRGAILNIASISSRRGTAKSAHYSAAKYGVIGLTEAAAADLREHGVRVNAILPGATSHKDFEPPADAKGPLGRILTPVEIAPLAMFLLSDDARMITGAAYDLFGGSQIKIG